MLSPKKLKIVKSIIPNTFYQCFIVKNSESTFLYIIALQQLHKTQVHASIVTYRMKTWSGYKIYGQPLNQCEKIVSNQKV